MTGNDSVTSFVDDQRLVRIANALASAGPGHEHRYFALDQHGFWLLRFEEEYARGIVIDRLHHLFESTNAWLSVDQRLHILIEVLTTIGEKARAPPVQGITIFLIRRPRPKELIIAAIPSPAIKKGSHIVPLFPGLRRGQVVAILFLKLLLILRPFKGDLVVEHNVNVTIERHSI